MSKGSSSRRRGFTLIEAIVSIVFVSVGIVSALSGLAMMSKNDYLLREREELQRLAVQKYDELIATGAIDTAELNGDFNDRNIDKYEWRAEVTPSGEENLNILTVTVKEANNESGPQAVVDGMLFQPPVASGGTGQ